MSFEPSINTYKFQQKEIHTVPIPFVLLCVVIYQNGLTDAMNLIMWGTD